MIEISRAARTEVERLLSDSDTGFNPTLADACKDFGCPLQAFTINFASPGTTFFRAPYVFEDLFEKVALEQWPVMLLYTRTATDEHEQVGVKFSGPINLYIDVYLRFAGRAPNDMESLAEAVESSLISVLTAGGTFQENVSPSRSGSMIIERAGPEFFSDAWYMGVHFNAEFLVTA